MLRFNRLAPALALSITAIASTALAQDQALPETTLLCANFKKNPDGNWVVVDDKPFRLGSTVVTINAGTIIRPGSVMIAGTNMYSLLEATCRQQSPAKSS